MKIIKEDVMKFYKGNSVTFHKGTAYSEDSDVYKQFPEIFEKKIEMLFDNSSKVEVKKEEVLKDTKETETKEDVKATKAKTKAPKKETIKKEDTKKNTKK